MLAVILLIAGLIVCYLACRGPTKPEEFKKKYLSKIDKGIISEEEFDTRAALFIELMNQVADGSKLFFFVEMLLLRRDVSLTLVDIKKLEAFNYDVLMVGLDHKGTWSAEGNFIMTQGGPFLWMLKVYEDR